MNDHKSSLDVNSFLKEKYRNIIDLVILVYLGMK